MSENAIKKELSFSEALFDVFWVCNLSNGETVYRNDVGERDSWLVLKDYLYANNLQIVGLYFKFRDNYIEIGRDKKAFFFTKMAKANYGSSSTEYYFCGGYSSDDGKSIHIKKFILPELLVMEEEDRPIDHYTLERGLFYNEREEI